MNNANKTLIFLTIFMAFNLSARAEKFKVGKVSKAELRMTNYDADPDAPAVILRDEGSVYFRFSPKGYFQVVHKRHVRIKILSKKGYSHADFEIPLYNYGQREDNIHGFKAYTFNMKNGKVVEEKLRKRDIMYDEGSKFWDYARFSMPKVKVGSVLDIEYSVNHPASYDVSDWYFQYDIPVVASSYKITIPEWFSFNRAVKGFENVKAHPVRSEVEKLYYFSNTYTVNADVYQFSIDSVPAFSEEPYMTTKENFISKVSFELRSTQLPNSNINYYTQSWADVSEELLNHPEFGGQIDRNHLKNEAKAIEAETSEESERLRLAHKKILSLIKYNGYDGVLPYYDNLKTSIKEKSGNSADINLNLIALLRKMDFQAQPVVLSTRQHGYIHPSHASLDALNYVLVLVKVGGKQILVDATEPHLPLGQIPFRCLNGSGILLDKENPQKIALLNQENYSRRISMIMDYTGDSVTGNMKTDLAGYFAGKEWKSMQEKGMDTYTKEKSGGNADWALKNLDAQWEGNTLVQRCEIDKANPFKGKPAMVYLNAIYGKHFDENPFKLQTRKYPVDFGCPYNYSYQVILKLPEEYTLENVPENVKVVLPEKGGSFLYSASLMGNQLVISSEFKINKLIYGQLQYPMIKQLFQHVVDKYNEKIVIKKI